MASKAKPVPVLVAESAEAAKAYQDTHPTEEFTVITPKSGTIPANVSRVRITRGMVGHPDRAATVAKVRARIRATSDGDGGDE